MTMKCNAAPYSGDERYMFVSYCHEDKAIVYPYIEMLAKRGFRVWYDDGIIPGDEWPETIAEKLSKCDFFLAFVTENSLNSHNCRREVNYAVQKNKPLTGVFLEEVQLTVSMEMIFATYQAVYRNKCDSHDECLEIVYRNTPIYRCLGERNPDIVVHDLHQTENKAEVIIEKKESNLYDEFFLKEKQIGGEPSNQPYEIKPLDVHEEPVKELVEEPVDKASENQEESVEEVYIDEKNENEIKLQITQDNNLKKSAYIYSFGRNDEFCINKDTYTIGRSIKDVDLVVLNNEVSKVHTIIQKINNDYYIKDNKSLNKVMVNGTVLDVNDVKQLHHLDLISLGREHFVFFEDGEKVSELDFDVNLTSISSNETIKLKKRCYRIGRNGQNNDLVIRQSVISKQHALIIIDNNDIYLYDLKSSNGTFINNSIVTAGKPIRLKNNDVIRFGNVEYVIKQNM